MVHVDCKNKKQLKQEVNVKDYYRVVKNKYGYLCFYNSTDFDRWARNKPLPYKVIKI